MGLNKRQERFAEEFVKTGNEVQSALNAGYADTTANKMARRLLDNVGVREYIAELNDKIVDESILTAKQAMRRLSDIASGNLKEDVVAFDPESGVFKHTEKSTDHSTQVRALSEIMKRYPLPIDINLNTPTEIKLVANFGTGDAEEPDDE
ncbi:terminase small subunit [Weissella soli]|uniref:terminase small subunit n=1 Tax=Weissella soli TaxID=155866 RepID=UPI003C706721